MWRGYRGVNARETRCWGWCGVVHVEEMKHGGRERAWSARKGERKCEGVWGRERGRVHVTGRVHGKWRVGRGECMRGRAGCEVRSWE